MSRRPVIIVLAIGLGLVAAPAIFQMFSRAPKGGQMINEFRPFMAQSKVEQFQGYMTQIGAAHEESSGVVAAEVGGNFSARFPSTAAFNEQWPDIFEDMNNGMLATMEDMVDNFAAVDALPPFPLFPYFFVAPGLIVAFLAWRALRAHKRGAPTGLWLKLLIVMGIGIVAAPAIFQMFTRAPKGAEMINEFRPLMTNEKLATVQGYFLTIGAAEGELRNQIEPKLGSQDLPALDALHENWGTISGNMAPMIGAMADNIDNYQAVDALPPFTLFPWFFVAPGLMIAGFAIAAKRERTGTTGAQAFASGLPPSADVTNNFFQELRDKADTHKRESQVSSKQKGE